MVFEATRLDVRGWVRNRLDGSVEAVFDGAPSARAALVAWALARARRSAGDQHAGACRNRRRDRLDRSVFTRAPTAR